VITRYFIQPGIWSSLSAFNHCTTAAKAIGSSSAILCSRREQRKTIIPTPHQAEVLNGVLAGGGGRIEKLATGARILAQQSWALEFSENNVAYANMLEEELSSLVANPSAPVNRPPHTKTGKIYNSSKFGTLTLPSLLPFYDRFVRDGTRVIPADIANGFTTVSLAFWIMNSGSAPEWGGLMLNTDRYTGMEVTLLLNMLEEKFRLDITYHKDLEQPRIRIKERHYALLRSLVQNHMHPDLQYLVRS